MSGPKPDIEMVVRGHAVPKWLRDAFGVTGAVIHHESHALVLFEDGREREVADADSLAALRAALAGP